jgi:putative ABC transport system substrate-binding protein
VKRRDLLGGALAGSTTWVSFARAQQREPARRVGVLLGIGQDDSEAHSRLSALNDGLAALGWRDSQNMNLFVRFGTGDERRIQPLAAELVRLEPDVILANSTPVLAAIKRETTTIPIVFAVVNDPVGQGFIQNLSRPGANITGFTAIDFEMIGKWMDLLQEVSPPVGHAGLLFSTATSPYYHSYLGALEATRGAQNITALSVGIASEIEPAVAKLARSKRAALIAPADAFNSVHRKEIIAAAQRHSLPAIYTYRYFASEGGLMSYGPDTADIFRRAAAYIDRILGGAKAGDLPVQQPTKFEFVINLITAKSLGLTIPPSLLARADEVIE